MTKPKKRINAESPPQAVYIVFPCNQLRVDVEDDMPDGFYLDRADAEAVCFQDNLTTLAMCDVYYPPVDTPEFEICADNLGYETEKERLKLIKAIKPKIVRENISKISSMPVDELRQLMANAFDGEDEGPLYDLIADMDIVWFGVMELKQINNSDLLGHVV